MAIFARRTIQRMLRENSSFLSPGQVRDFARKLNKADQKSIHSEWELALLNVLAKSGQVAHERPFGNKLPDIYFSIGDKPNQTLIADVRTVSDKGLVPESLVDLFKKRLRQELGKRKLRFNHFSCELKGLNQDSTIESYMNSELLEFLDAVATARSNPAKHVSKDQTVFLTYDPAQASYTWSAPITWAKRLSNNPFYNALNDKLDQLEAPGFEGSRGIILCDGGSNMFFFRQSDAFHHGSDDIIKSFLRSNSNVDFVMTVWVERTPEPSQSFRLYRIKSELFPNENFARLDEKLRGALSNIEPLFPLAPVTVDIAISSIHQGRGKQRWGFHYWKPTMSEDKKEIRISAIGLLQLLSGELKQDDFLEDQGFKSKGRVDTTVEINPFLKHFRAGELISDISIEHSELDDDYIIIRFDGKDAAVSPYTHCTDSKSEQY
jgi:hypothetical protein